MKIIGISGSTKGDAPSLNNAVLETIGELMPDDVDFEKLTITNLPLYSEHYDTDFPTEATAFKEAIKAADAIIITTPEHNRSVPAALKNAVDWGTRPYGDNVWDGKPMLIMGATGGMLGTYGAQHHLRDMLAHNSAYVLPEPALHICLAHDKIADGRVTDTVTKEHLETGIQRLIDYANQLASK